MKKKKCAILLTTVFSAMALSACAGAETKTKVTTTEYETLGETEETEEEISETEGTNEDTAADGGASAGDDSSVEADAEETQTADQGDVVLDEKQQSALYVMDALMMCNTETGKTYAPKDPDYFWTALFYLVGNYGSLREGSGAIESDGVEGIAKVNYRVAQEYATALFEDYSDLLEVPADMTSVTVNPDDSEQYLFLMGDRGLSAARITAWTDNGDGTYSASAELFGTDDKRVIATGEFTLVDNPYLDGITEPIFYYTVSTATVTVIPE